MSKFKIIIVIFTMCFILLQATAQTNVWNKTFPDGLITYKNESYNVNNLNSKQFIGLYFSAGWCRGCRAFTPQLIEFLSQHNDKMEVVMINFDKTEEDMMAYMNDYPMPWPAVKFGTIAIKQLKNRFNVSEIPTLIIMDTKGRVLTLKAYDEIIETPDTCIENWQNIENNLK